MVKKFKPTAIFEKLASTDADVASEGVEELEAGIAEEELDERMLREGLKDKRRPVRVAIARVLHEADDENLDALLVLAKDGTDEERKQSLWDVENKGRNPRVLAALVSALEDTNQEVREAAQQGLREVSTFELDPGKAEDLVSKSKFGGAPDGLATDDIPEGSTFVAQFTREDVGLKKFAMAYFFVKEGPAGVLVLGGGGPRSKPKKDEAVYAISLGEGANILTPLTPNWQAGPVTPRCTCGKDMRFLAELSSFDELKVLPEGKAGSFYLFACQDECRTVSAQAIYQEKKK